MSKAKDLYDAIEQDTARRLIRQELGPWLAEVEPFLVKLRRHADPDVKATAGEIQHRIVRLVTGK